MRLSSTHVLIIDDSPEDRELIRRTLQSLPESRYRFTEVSNGEQALALCREQPLPEVAFLDVNLPDMDGQEILQALAEEHNRVPLPIIVLTGSTSSAAANQMLAAGAQDFVQKSYIGGPLLAQVVNNSIERFRLAAELRNSEARLQLHERAINAAPNGIVIVDPHQPDCPLVYVNSGFEKMTGYCGEEVLGRNCRFLQGPQTEPEALDMLREALLNRVYCKVTLLNYRKDGSTFWNDLQITPVLDPQGQLSHYVGTQTDVSERRQSELSLQQALYAADAANRAKSAFLATMSHEIRSPMAAILGYADVLAANISDSEQLANIAVIKRNGAYLLELINDILDLSKIETGKLDIVSAETDLSDLIADVYSLMSVRAQDKQLPLDVEYHSPIPRRILSDATRLRQILINLLSNAIKFTERGRVRLTVSYMPERTQLTMAVIDTGIGMSEDEQQQLFQPFTQSPSARHFGGTGLGLAISQRLAHLLGGEITVQSQPMQGSTFTVRLSVNCEGEPELIQPRYNLVRSEGDSTPLPKLDCRVLIADDREDIRQLIRHFLERAGATVVTVGDGAEALAVIEQASGQSFDAIILDMHMPALDGFQAAWRLREAGFEHPIIALTASAMQGERERCLQAGCTDYLTKPVKAHDLIELIQRHVASAQSDASRPGSPASPQPRARPVSASAPNSAPVLLVEDNPDARAATASLLELAGHRVLTAADGQSALSLAQTARPQVVFCDIGLPDIDGYRLVQQLRALPGLHATVFVALSGETAESQAASQGGFDHHLIKPAGLRELLALIPSQQADANTPDDAS